MLSQQIAQDDSQFSHASRRIAAQRTSTQKQLSQGFKLGKPFGLAVVCDTAHALILKKRRFSSREDQDSNVDDTMDLEKLKKLQAMAGGGKVGE